MRLLADYIASVGTPPDPRWQHFQQLLKKPADNHSAQSIQPSLERFVFPRESYNTLKELSQSDLIDFESTVHPPLRSCWVEIHAEHQPFGYWISPDSERISLTCIVKNKAGGWGRLAEAFIDADGQWKILSQYNDENAQYVFTALKVAFALIASHRFVSTDLVIPRATSASDRALHRRRAQDGCPVYSYNVVTLRRPETCNHRGVLKSVESFAGKRGHMVIGHWRLIEGALEPYWTWVDGHARGDKALGWVTKERHVALKPTKRRAFATPFLPGTPGQRVPAIRAH